MQIIILAAGKGSRMQSELPKVMHKVGEKTMLEHVVYNSRQVTNDLLLVYSEHIEQYLYMFKDRCKLVKQDEQLGTAHAVAIAKNSFNNRKNIGVIYGDNPLITAEIISRLFEQLKNTNAKVVTLAFEDKEINEYGRILLDQNGNFLKIVEAKLATWEEKKITLCNSGIMIFAPGILTKYIDRCLENNTNNPGKELYLTSIIEIMVGAGEKVSYYLAENKELVIGVNTQEELKAANSTIETKII